MSPTDSHSFTNILFKLYVSEVSLISSCLHRKRLVCEVHVSTLFHECTFTNEHTSAQSSGWQKYNHRRAGETCTGGGGGGPPAGGP